jgi:hypothetical protein
MVKIEVFKQNLGLFFGNLGFYPNLGKKSSRFSLKIVKIEVFKQNLGLFFSNLVQNENNTQSFLVIS